MSNCESCIYYQWCDEYDECFECKDFYSANEDIEDDIIFEMIESGRIEYRHDWDYYIRDFI